MNDYVKTIRYLKDGTIENITVSIEDSDDCLLYIIGKNSIVRKDGGPIYFEDIVKCKALWDTVSLMNSVRRAQ